MNTDNRVYRDVLVALRQIVKAADARSKRIARETGLTTTQVLALQVIDNATTVTAGALAGELNLTQATVTTIISRLESRGLIARARDEADRRRVRVTLTADGAAALRDAPQALQDVLAARFTELETWEQHQILAVVQRLASLMDASRIEAAPVLDVGTLNSP